MLEDADGDQCTVTVQVSNDGGSTWTVPAARTFLAHSAIGPNIASTGDACSGPHEPRSLVALHRFTQHLADARATDDGADP
jgi:hypothetical protein